MQLGERDPDAMLASMSTSTFLGWQVYAAIEPFGEYRSELRHGQQMALTANINRNTKVKATPFKETDFMNFVERPQEKQLTPEEAFAKIDADVFGV